MDDTEIRLHCVEVAEGDLHRAKQIYNWVTNRDELKAGPQVIPAGYAMALAYGDHKASGISLVKA